MHKTRMISCVMVAMLLIAGLGVLLHDKQSRVDILTVEVDNGDKPGALYELTLNKKGNLSSVRFALVDPANVNNKMFCKIASITELSRTSWKLCVLLPNNETMQTVVALEISGDAILLYVDGEPYKVTVKERNY